MDDEIKKIFDVFKGGYYKYENNGNKLIMEDLFSSPSLDVIFNGESCSIWNYNSVPACYYRNLENDAIEGSLELITPELSEKIMSLIIDCKHYLEENGFDAVKYENELAEQFTHCINTKDRVRKDYFERNYANMKRIYEDEPIVLFWK